MITEPRQVMGDIHNHIQKRGGRLHSWYVGISEDPERRLFNEHNVRRIGDAWIYRHVASIEIARKIEDYFIRSGADGGPGGGDEDATGVYAYKKSSNTGP